MPSTDPSPGPDDDLAESFRLGFASGLTAATKALRAKESDVRHGLASPFRHVADNDRAADMLDELSAALEREAARAR